MARIASQSKGGYYATPPEETALICNRLIADKGLVNIVDFCCGEGAALKQMGDHLITQGADVKMFGVELEKDRATYAQQVLDKVVKGGYETLRASNEVFSYLWLNPPYDQSKLGQRTELVFLRDLTAPDKYLQPGGLLGFCIPQHVLEDCAHLLAFRFDDLKVYRFTEKNYPNFKQIVVFGYRKKGKDDPQKVKEIKKRLIAIGNSPPSSIPTLDEEDGVYFKIPQSRGEVKLFRGYVLDPVEIAEDIDKSPAWNEFENMLMPYNLRNDSTLKKPVLPLKPTHMATAIAAGAVGGNMTNHILVGLTTKKIENRTEYEEGINSVKEKKISTERHVTSIRIFSQHKDAKGVYTLE